MRPGGSGGGPVTYTRPGLIAPEVVISYPDSPLVEISPQELEVFHHGEDMAEYVQFDPTVSVFSMPATFDFPYVQRFDGFGCLLGVRPSGWSGGMDEKLKTDVESGRFVSHLLGAQGAGVFEIGGGETVLISFSPRLSKLNAGMVGILQDAVAVPQGGWSSFWEDVIPGSVKNDFETVGYFRATEASEMLLACISPKDEVSLAMVQWADLLARISIR